MSSNTEEIVFLPDHFAEDILGTGGLLSQEIKGYEQRQGQISLAQSIGKAFNNSEILVAEAGTGIGKSFAYLIPSMLWSVKNKETVVISTATITLQEQLIRKDVPMVQNLLQSKARVELAKGRQNYLCWKRFEEVLAENLLYLEFGKSDLDSLNTWVQNTVTGDKSELTISCNEQVWQKINCESDTCLGKNCLDYDRCFLNIARKKLEQADIVIANHHLVFADLKLRQLSSDVIRILPAYCRLIFDESHNIIHSATSFFSGQITHFSVNRLLTRFFRRKGQHNFGLLAQVEYFFQNSSVGKRQLDKAFSLLEQCREANQQLSSQSSLNVQDTFRLSSNVPVSLSIENGVLIPLNNLSVKTKQFYQCVKKIADMVSEQSESNLPLVIELKQALQRIKELAVLAKSFMNYTNDTESVYWGERRKTSAGEEYVRLESTPLDLGKQMCSMVYDAHETIIMVSATLSINGDFSYFNNNLGLNNCEKKTHFYSYLSPFNYHSAVFLGIPLDGPSPDDLVFDDYVAKFLGLIFSSSLGKGLALFTSYRAMHHAYQAVKEKLESLGVLVLIQGQMARHQLIHDFQKHGHAVLMATDSFWEGIDIDNRCLKVVIMCRLPFTSPNSPVAQAKGEIIEKKGLSAFMQLQVPEAAIKLRQGFGRLIRRDGDFGLIYILDNRIKKKNYGKILLQSLPAVKQHVGNSRDLINKGLLFLKDKSE